MPKRNLATASLLGSALLLMPSLGLSAPPQPPASQADPDLVLTCQQITASGTYQLAADLQSTSNAPCVFIDADSVVLDLFGFSIIGSDAGASEDGIFINNRNNIKITNGTVYGFGNDGISSNNTSIGITVTNILTRNNGRAGIRLTGQMNTIENCKAINNDEEGILVGNYSAVRNSYSNMNGDDGIYASRYSIISGNIVSSNDGAGITDSDKGTIISENVVRNHVNGPAIHGNTDSIVINNSVLNNNSGITGNRNTIIRNNVISAQTNGRQGVSLSDQDNVVEGNLIVGFNNNLLDGAITLPVGSSGNWCVDNRLSGNANAVRDLSGGANPDCIGDITF